MTTISSTGEVGSFRDVDQFQPAKTQFACGFFSGAILKAMGEPGATPTQSVTQMIAEAESWYAADDGSNSISNMDGMSLAQEYDMIVNKMGMHYQAITPSAQAVAAWVRDGYPVMLTITETSVYDLYLPGNPYTAWRPAGNHIFVVTGVTTNNNFLVRDPANCTSLTDPHSLRPGPRLYRASQLQIINATVVVPPWKPRPISSTAPNAPESVVAGFYADISQYQNATLDYSAYRAWATKNGGVARLAIRASEGTGVIDAHYQGYRQGAQQNGIKLIHYHFADPDLNSPQAEASYFQQVVGTIGPDDQLMLDYEKNVPQATAEWALAWLEQIEQAYGRTPLVYASPSFIKGHLSDSRLARFGLVLAEWTYDPTKQPTPPAPWKALVAWQYSDKETVPGIGSAVDANLYLAGDSMITGSIPAGWTDTGVSLMAPNGHKVVTGFRAAILAHPNWDPGNQPNEDEYGTDQVLLHNASVGKGTRQTFRDGFFWWTSAKGVVWEPYPGLEIKACYDLIASLQTAAPAPAPMPNIIEAIAMVEDSLAASGVIATSLNKALSDLKQ